MPESFWVEPLMYQGGSDGLLGATENFILIDEKFGLDLEAEIGVITDDVPMGISEKDALDHIRLIVLLNDWSYRELIAPELAKGFGFVNSKPATSFAPIALTPDEFGDLWHEGKLNASVESKVNGIKIGCPLANVDMVFGFGKLISHAAKTRNLVAGTIIGSGTVANRDISRGSSCLLEKRMLEVLANGKATTPYLKIGDIVSIEVFGINRKSVFGAIHQKVVGVNHD
jgi:fumarylacetoacetate (FAA) hydrolase